MIVIRCDGRAAQLRPARRLRDHIERAPMRLGLASGATTFLDEAGGYTVANEHGGVVHYHIDADPRLPPVRRRLRG
jgi:hypothetical protein